jgi:hypothetical protein
MVKLYRTVIQWTFQFILVKVLILNTKVGTGPCAGISASTGASAGTSATASKASLGWLPLTFDTVFTSFFDCWKLEWGAVGGEKCVPAL